MDGTLAEIKLFACDYAPEDWHICDGAILQIQQNAALYSLLGVRYGGDMKTTFALPDLRGWIAIGAGYSHRIGGNRLTTHNIGDKTGVDNEVLSLGNFPMHTHGLQCNSTAGSGTDNNPAGNYMGVGPTDRSTGVAVNTRYAVNPTDGAIMAADAVSTVGGSSPVDIRQPVMGLNYIICVKGNYPVRQ